MLKTVKNGSGIRVETPHVFFLQNSYIFPFFLEMYLSYFSSLSSPDTFPLFDKIKGAKSRNVNCIKITHHSCLPTEGTQHQTQCPFYDYLLLRRITGEN